MVESRRVLRVKSRPTVSAPGRFQPGSVRNRTSLLEFRLYPPLLDFGGDITVHALRHDYYDYD